MTVTIRKADPAEPQATALLQASHALMRLLFPPEDNYFLEIEELRVPSITFLVAEGPDGVVLGTGALARKDGYAEVKSMFVAPEARGQGVAAKVLHALEQLARDEDVAVMRLETGTLLDAAHRLYERHGFVARGPFGDYTESASSLFFEKSLRG
ncbi:GNAT family N-acetyltransferase [Mesobacterium sp. TK19101]|uniref:GNAT family N-acetyltransferase n=1 Tax=Mesobacterium hydrothermale TaxID=3111907 RepID=A0ABU6HBU4_9RHOB|nr:GNAT family N-acetyltransferase [Mesobacterium sp. TK19101]MEC3859721.1 GNAT family N-acetyltransferase [Mesobacterium sp. TK19101]